MHSSDRESPDEADYYLILRCVFRIVWPVPPPVFGKPWNNGASSTGASVGAGRHRPALPENGVCSPR
jgi:hypothetical protein